MALRSRLRGMPVDVWVRPDAAADGDGPAWSGWAAGLPGAQAPVPSGPLALPTLADAAGHVMVLTRGVDVAPSTFGVAAVCVAPAGLHVAPGLVGRLLTELQRPGRRLVRVETGGPSLALWHPELLAAAGLPVADVLDDVPGLDRRVAALELGLEPGQWRHWLDGRVVGAVVPAVLGDRDPATWAQACERATGTLARVRTGARSAAGRVRREVQLARARHS